MTENLDHDAVAALIQERLDEGRAAGRYSDDLDEQLASQFQRAAVDPLTFPALEALRTRVGSFRIPSVARLKVPTESSIPGGSQMHRFVVKVVARQLAAVIDQVTEVAIDAQAALGGVVGALDEIRSIVTTEVFADIDSVHHRLVAVEQRLSRLEAAPQAAEQPADDA